MQNISRRAVFCVLFYILAGQSIFSGTSNAAQADESAANSDAIAQLRHWLATPREKRTELTGESFAKAPLNMAQARVAGQLLWEDWVAQVKETRSKEWKDEQITIGDKTMKLKERHFGNKPKDGWNLFISMHGGGNAPAELNDQQWENQIRLYQPKDSLYIAPRAPTNTWNLWHEPHIDALFGRLIQDAIVLGDVNPNRVYIMGYSAGGDGVYQLAPRMADRLAAASMMAGHPNDASPLGLRNIGFTIHVGANDDGYNRNKVAEQWKQKLDDLQAADPSGYVHDVQLHPGRGHWMNLEDRVALDWMLRFTRNPTPAKVVWKRSTVTHDRFYWLAVSHENARKDQLVVASRDKQHITIEKAEDVPRLTVMLNDSMLDLDQPIVVSMGGKELFNGVTRRTIGQMEKTLSERGDPFLVFNAAVDVNLDATAK